MDKHFGKSKSSPVAIETQLVRLNKFIANSGVCSRREADQLIQQGEIKVNGKIITELGYKVVPDKDKIYYQNNKISGEKKVYILLNKPKGFICTNKDPENRKTALSLVRSACDERVYSVGRLDIDSTGVLLFTNDGELAKKLTHPSHKITKIYYVKLDKELEEQDLKTISKGVNLEEGKAVIDNISYVNKEKSKREIGIEIHIGWNRVIRRIFQKIGYKVMELDRVSFAGLTKKNVPRGSWRLISVKEVAFLRMLAVIPLLPFLFLLA